MTQTETPRKVTTPEEAVKVLNSTAYRGRDDWEVVGIGFDAEPSFASPGGCLHLDQWEALAVANALSGYTDALEAENQRLKADRDHEYQCANSYHKKWTRNADEVEILRQERDTLREAAHKLVAAIPPWRFGQGLIAEKRDALIAALAQQPEVK